MLKKKDFVVSSLFIYLVLILLTFFLRDKRSFKYVCSTNSGCVRFCCNDDVTCNEDFIRMNFNESLVPTIWGSDEEEATQNIKVMLGKPNCNLELISSEDEWQFLHHGDIFSNMHRYESDEYCLEDSKVNDIVEWNVFLCRSFDDIQWNLAYVFILITMLFLIGIIGAYWYYKELRADDFGKISLSFVMSFAIALSSLFLVRIRYRYFETLIVFVFLTGFVFSLLWMSLLIFDIWKNSRKKASSDGSSRFRFYCYLFCGLSILLTLYAIWSIEYQSSYVVYNSLLIVLALMMTVKIVLLIMSAVNILKMSKSKSHSAQAKYKREAERFWTTVQVFLIMFITSFFELLILGLDKSYELKIIVDVMKCFSAFLLFSIFVLNEKSRRLFMLK